jgi:hypothetical protein
MTCVHKLQMLIRGCPCWPLGIPTLGNVLWFCLFFLSSINILNEFLNF